MYNLSDTIARGHKIQNILTDGIYNLQYKQIIILVAKSAAKTTLALEVYAMQSSQLSKEFLIYVLQELSDQFFYFVIKKFKQLKRRRRRRLTLITFSSN